MIGRPLLITDCDEVLLHMVAHFQDWLGEAHAIDFAFETGDFAGALTHRDSGAQVAADRVWPLLTDFFRGEMHRQTLVPGAIEALGRIGEVADIVILTNLGDRQTLVPGAIEALGRIGEVADIVILTNLGDEAHGWRVEQLAAHGIAHEVVCNQGGKGVPARAIIDRLGASNAVFVDDLPVHHASVAKHAPEAWRLHMVAEPRLAPAVPKAEQAHARIDDWPTATPWILDKLGGS